MAQEELLNWIRDGLKKGRSKEDITKSLKEAGHSDSQIRKAFDETASAKAPQKGKNLLPGIVAGVIIVATIVAFVLNSDLLGPKTPETPPSVDLGRFNVLVDEGWELMVDDNFEDAAVKFTEATEVNPNDPYGFGSLGWVLLGQDKNAEAEEAFLQVRALDPTTPYGYLGLAVVYHRQDRLEEAKEMASTGVGIATEQYIDWVLQWDSGFRSLLSP